VPRLLIAAAATLAALTHPAIAAAQCAMCRATLLSSPEAQALIGGLRQGTILLLLVPFAIVVLVVRRLRRGGIIASAPAEQSRNEFPSIETR
jgi:hypothetical protein